MNVGYFVGSEEQEVLIEDAVEVLGETSIIAVLEDLINVRMECVRSCTIVPEGKQT